jgi:hypothetical protein
MRKIKLPRLTIKNSVLNHLIQGIVVFASVFLAFWLTEIRENNKNKKEVEIAFKTIAIEMNYNHERIIQTFKYHYNILQQIDSIEQNNPSALGKLYGYQLSDWLGIQLPMLRSTAYKTLINSGIISKLNFETQKDIADIYTIQKIIEDIDYSMTAATVNDVSLARLDKVRHLSILYTDILPDVIGFYQVVGRPLFEEIGYSQQIEDGLLKTIVDEKFKYN